MSLFKQWEELGNNLSDKEFEKFWDEYSTAEIKIYSDLLTNPSRKLSGVFSELVSKYEVTDVLFMGFLDGINSSLKTALNVEEIDENSEIELDVDFEKLYYNMHVSEAEHLYSLEEWDALLSDELRTQIAKDYKKSKTFIKEQTPGRNDPCSCGSGKKYKKCCG
jgi:biotin-(acetyl-CoA carboxylase) ligase